MTSLAFARWALAVEPSGQPAMPGQDNVGAGLAPRRYHERLQDALSPDRVGELGHVAEILADVRRVRPEPRDVN